MNCKVPGCFREAGRGLEGFCCYVHRIDDDHTAYCEAKVKAATVAAFEATPVYALSTYIVAVGRNLDEKDRAFVVLARTAEDAIQEFRDESDNDQDLIDYMDWADVEALYVWELGPCIKYVRPTEWMPEPKENGK